MIDVIRFIVFVVYGNPRAESTVFPLFFHFFLLFLAQKCGIFATLLKVL